MPSDTEDGAVLDERGPELYSALYVLFGVLWGLALYLDRAPLSLGELTPFDGFLILAAVGSLVIGALGLSSPERFAVDDPNRWQFALMVFANIAAGLSLLYQLA